MMLDNNRIFTVIAKTLLADHSSIYYVDALTNEYLWYSLDPESRFLKLEGSGDDFFNDLIRIAEQEVCEEDRHIFTSDIQREELLKRLGTGEMQRLEYRLMTDGGPVYHALSVIKGTDEGEDYFILGVKNIDEQVKGRAEADRIARERQVYDQIAGSLAEHYDTLYYIDMETNEYFEYSSTDVYKKLQIPVSGSDFFAQSRRNIKKYVHPDDYDTAMHIFDKLVMKKNIGDMKTFTLTYRLVAEGEVMNVRCSQMWASDKRHAIVCIENINDEIAAQNELIESRRKSEAYGMMAESLASHYDVLYYVDSSNGSYNVFTINSIYGSADIKEEGKDFFADAARNAEALVHPKDSGHVKDVLSRDFLISALESKKLYSTEYRLLINGRPQYTRLSAMRSNDKAHFIIGVENIDDEVKRENEQVRALGRANELARRDMLTGTKNKNAYSELEESVQYVLDEKLPIEPFAIVVCDINDLKSQNDALGHKAGDEYICAASRLICNVFTHSPVFRIGGDEFAVFLSGRDYEHKDGLIARLREQVIENIKSASGPVLASGMAIYEQGSDSSVADVFKRADNEMYEHKTALKNGKFETLGLREQMTEEEIRRLDGLFSAFELTSEGAFVFLCNIKHNLSRWSKAAADHFGLPSEYMHDAGAVWEEHIHPDDRATYRASISDIFSGNASSHDMQYRAMKPDGEYDVCTCRGTVIRSSDGTPEWFAGVIRSHGIHSHIDALTGLRNQYGFFEDVEAEIHTRREIHVVMTAISKFSEINEVYGYQFGNAVLQKFGRYLFESIGNLGSVYRLDGTKFAILSRSGAADELRRRYDEMKEHFRKGLSIDGRFAVLELSAGMISVDNYATDSQTVYACLNFAYGESKLHMQGEMVEFYNDLNDNNRRRIEKLYEIRASIMQDFNGFYLMYQPVVDAATEKLIGAEALLRWRNNEYGIVPPDHFIPVLEKDPLFCELGQWILRTAVNGAKLIMEDHPDFIVNVNLSYTQLEKPDFVEMVLRTLHEEGFPPEHLCMEITERCRLLDMHLLKSVIVDLRGHGIQIALDDFGTGFASVGLVKSIPFDTIKIDRSFVMMIEDDEKERDLVKSFAGIARTYGAKVCVEGIETEGMRDILQQFNIQSFQGYYYGKPLEFREFLRWDDNRKK